MKDYKNYFLISAAPEDVFTALTNPATIQLWSGEPAKMISFETGKKIVQEWFFGEQEEKSIVTMIFHPHKQGTSAELRHTNIPDEDYDDIVAGWNDVYFSSLIDFYED
jgi:uncharacterized protein YndB with AHSA1/START domain